MFDVRRWSWGEDRSSIMRAVSVALLCALFAACCAEVEIDPDRTCYGFSNTPFRPVHTDKSSMLDCCWYHDETCCSIFWLREGLQQMHELSMTGISEQCYLAAADTYCNFCAPDTRNFMSVGRERRMVVRLCYSTCTLFYDACRAEAAALNMTSAGEFCEGFSRGFHLQDNDDDETDDTVYQMARTDERCFISEGVLSGWANVKNEYGRCLPIPVQPADLAPGEFRFVAADREPQAPPSVDFGEPRESFDDFFSTLPEYYLDNPSTGVAKHFDSGAAPLVMTIKVITASAIVVFLRYMGERLL